MHLALSLLLVVVVVVVVLLFKKFWYVSLLSLVFFLVCRVSLVLHVLFGVFFFSSSYNQPTQFCRV